MLNYEQALHLLKMEPTQEDGINLVDSLLKRKQITEGTAALLQDWLNNNF